MAKNTPLGQLSKFGDQNQTMMQLGALSGFLQKPSLQTGLSSGLKYFANANPYVAGINALTGGMLDKGIDQIFRKRGPAQDLKQTQQLTDQARQSMENTNRLKDVYAQSITNAEQARAARELFRKSVARLKTEGASAREMQPMMSQIAARNAQLGQAYQSRLAANLSARGINPASGIGAGAMAGLEGQLAGSQANAMNQLQVAALNRALQGEQMLFGADVADQARATQMRGALASELAQGGRADLAFAEQQRLNREARDQAMYARRFGESQQLGAGVMGLANLYLQSKMNRVDPSKNNATVLNASIPNQVGKRTIELQGGRPIVADPTFTRPLVGTMPNANLAMDDENVSSVDPEYTYNLPKSVLGVDTTIDYNSPIEINRAIDYTFALLNGNRPPREGEEFVYGGKKYTRISGRWYDASI